MWPKWCNDEVAEGNFKVVVGKKFQESLKFGLSVARHKISVKYTVWSEEVRQHHMIA